MSRSKKKKLGKHLERLEKKKEWRNKKNSVQNIQVKTEVDAETEIEKISPSKGPEHDFDVKELLTQAGFNGNHQTEKGITYYISNTDPVTVVFFSGSNFDGAIKRGNAVFSSKANCWRLQKINSHSKLGRTRGGSDIAQISFSISKDVWIATLITHELKRGKREEIFSKNFFHDTPTEKEEILFQGGQKEIFLKTAQKVRELMISALQS